ncbi:MAG: hypothetical protein K2I93_06105 [Oscillospiraceae bacterium]|nr:hypothetical protein [Oscillospiraceae bacterium]
MKRIFALFCLTSVLLTGCSMPQGSSGTVTNRMTGSFCAEVTVTTAENETKGILTRFGTDAWCVEFSEPAALSGVKLDFLDEEVTASYKGLEFSVPQSAQALKTELSELMDVVDTMAQTMELQGSAKDGNVSCEGELEVGDYMLVLNGEGVPLSFSLPAYGLVIVFDSFTDQNAVPETEATTIPKTYPVTDEVPCEETAEAAEVPEATDAVE